MIRGHDSGYDSRKCNMHVIINFVYAISGNTQFGARGRIAKKLNTRRKLIFFSDFLIIFEVAFFKQKFRAVQKTS